MGVTVAYAWCAARQTRLCQPLQYDRSHPLPQMWAYIPYRSSPFQNFFKFFPRSTACPFSLLKFPSNSLPSFTAQRLHVPPSTSPNFVLASSSAGEANSRPVHAAPHSRALPAPFDASLAAADAASPRLPHLPRRQPPALLHGRPLRPGAVFRAPRRPLR
ncbi:metallophosphoesterase [Chondrus crispus]|uniref:Metallophosphoesterase n=1 Tax=Chondrus crispus TaxID=2769 RepID=R7QMF1_CHOCR|nr:metallophosphoesterase [Chondrus crispus]CDF39687.1 metallophosphoesterase [Chondrus crispus]|eukprot:XP_005709981.1 metallophosphoesterase [Chondrus crispus]